MKLLIPPVAPQPDPSVETRAVYVEEWIESLPYANPQTLLQNLHRAVHALNRNPVKPGVRSTLLEHYLGPYHFLIELRRNAAPPQGGSAVERHRKEASALSALARELSVGYLRALADGLSRSTLFGRGGELAAAIQRGCALLTCSLVHRWEGYLPAPAETWQELHTLFLFARARGAEHQAGAPSGTRTELLANADTSYKRALLCALVDPYRLPYGEVWRVFDALADDAGSAQMGEMREVTRNVGLFAVTPGTPSPPVVPLARLDAESLPPETLLFDTNPLLGELQARLERRRSDGANGESSSSVAMLGRLIRAFGVPPRRHSPRRAERGNVQLVAGLSAIHMLLGGTAKDIAHASDPQEGEVVVEEDWDDAAAEETAFHRYAAAQWEVSDRGSGGVGVAHGPHPESLPAVGELTGVQFPGSDDGAWSVGVLRWLNMNNDGSYRAGVQLLADTATPALVESRGNVQAPAQPALLLATGGNDSGRSLLVPSGIYKRNGDLVVHANGERLQVRMDKLLEASSLYEKLSFQSTRKS